MDESIFKDEQVVAGDDADKGGVKDHDKGDKIDRVDDEGKGVVGVPKDVLEKLNKKDGEDDKTPAVKYEKDVLEKLPEKYRNAKDPLKALAEAHLGLEKKLHEKSAEKAPEKYEAPVMPEELKKLGIDINKDDPTYKWFEGFAKQNGMSQETFNSAAIEYVKQQAASVPNPAEELKKLGPNAEQIKTDTFRRITRHLEMSKEELNTFKSWVTTADELRLMNKFATLLGGGRESITAEKGMQPESGAVTRESLKAAMADPRMRTDPKFRKETMDAAYKNQHLFGKK